MGFVYKIKYNHSSYWLQNRFLVNDTTACSYDVIFYSFSMSTLFSALWCSVDPILLHSSAGTSGSHPALSQVLMLSN